MKNKFLFAFSIFLSLLSHSQTVIVSDNTWKGIGSLSSVPGNSWLLQGFDDSAWPLVEAPNPGNTIPVVPGSQSMWVLPYSDSAFMRKTFIVPVADSYSGTISINADNEFTLFFNGVSQGFFNNWMGGPYVFNISPSLQGCVENIVAVSSENWGGPFGTSLNTTINVTNPLTTPIADSATQITCTSFTANWDTVLTATNYLLDVSIDPNFSTFFSVYQDFNVGLTTSYNVTGTSPGTIYYYRLRAERPPLTSCYSNTITVNHQYTFSAGSNSPICQGELLLLTTNCSDPNATYSWSGPNFTSTQSNPVVNQTSPPQTGNYIVTVTMTGCAPFNDTINAVVNANYDQYLDTGFCFGGSIQIGSQTISVAGNQTFNLQTVNGCDSILHYYIVEFKVHDFHFYEEICYDHTYLLPDGSTTSDEGIYPFPMIDVNGCDSTVTIHLNVLGPDSCVLIIPNVFSPNQDGANEHFTIQGILGTDNRLQIFNRWGQLVFTSENYLNNWDGKSSENKVLPDGVYYYIFKTDEDVYSGHVTLIR